MAEDRDNSAAAQDELPGDDQRSRAHHVLRDLGDRFERRMLRNLFFFLLITTSIVSLGVLLRYLTVISRSATERDISLSVALEELDAGYVEQARQTAVDLRQRGGLSAAEEGGPAYVLGIAMMHDAAQRLSPRERRALYLLAARYLEEAQQQGFPPGRQGHGQLMLGKAHFETGHYAASLVPLQQAIEADVSGATEAHRWLSMAYLRDTTPQLAKALDHIQRFLVDPAITGESREEALLIAAEIQYQLGQIEACRQTLAQLPVDSQRQADALLMQGKLSLRQGDALQDETQPGVNESAAVSYRAAKQAFADAQQWSPGNGKLVRQAQYLSGLADRKLGNFPEAERQFSRTRRSNYDTAEGFAAGFEEAEVKRLLDRHEEAIDDYARVLRQAVDMPVYSNPWISLNELRDRSERAYRDYFEASEFDRAIRMANALSPLFSAEKSLQLQADAHRAHATELKAEAADKPAREQADLLAASHAAWRKAGALFEELAGLRFATRRYPDSLWNSAESYLNGHDYRRAARLLKSYLRNQIRREHPPALTALGQAELALGRPAEALESLQECIALFPRDPHSYRARLLGAEAHVELGNRSRAKQLLIENLENEALTPRSLEWRESLYALGTIHYQEGLELETQSRLDGVDSLDPVQRKAAIKSLELAQEAFHQTISRLSEAVQRDRLSQRDRFNSQTLEARYLIAESHRQSAKLPLHRLAVVTIETTRNQLNAEIQQELSSAENEYRELQLLLNNKQEAVELTPLEKRMLRNTYFSRADVLYDLERYDEAIQAYATATNRYQHEPESLEAYVQIANCHRQLNRHSEARGTLEQAKVVLNRIRPEADFTRTTRYNREEWQRLLDWLTKL